MAEATFRFGAAVPIELQRLKTMDLRARNLQVRIIGTYATWPAGQGWGCAACVTRARTLCPFPQARRS